MLNAREKFRVEVDGRYYAVVKINTLLKLKKEFGDRLHYAKAR